MTACGPFRSRTRSPKGIKTVRFLDWQSAIIGQSRIRERSKGGSGPQTRTVRYSMDYTYTEHGVSTYW